MPGSAINDLAWFRGMVPLLANGQEDSARMNLDAPPTRPGGTARSAGRPALQPVRHDRRGARRVRSVATSGGDAGGPTLATLQALGVTNVDATTLCSVPQG